MSEYVKNFFDKIATRYYERDVSLLAPIHLINLVKSLASKKVLEVGCGYGRNLELLKGKGIELWGVDFSKKILAIAGKSSINYSCQDMTRLNFEKNSFDVVFSHAALVHLNPVEVSAAVSEMKRVSSCFVIASEPDLKNVSLWLRPFRKRYVFWHSYEGFDFNEIGKNLFIWRKGQ